MRSEQFCRALLSVSPCKLRMTFNILSWGNLPWPHLNLCCCCSDAQSCLTLCNTTDHGMTGSSVLHYLPEFAQIPVYWVCDALQPCDALCYPLLLLPSIFPSIRVFSHQSALCIRWPKDWSFSFSISPFNEYSGLISFRIDWFDLLAVQGTFKSLLQHHN